MALNLITKATRNKQETLWNYLAKSISSQNGINCQKFVTPVFSIKSRLYSSTVNNSREMRFIQYKRKDEPATRLGIISEDGGKIVDLSALCPHMKDMIGFIKAGPNGMQKIQEKSSEFKWDNVTDNIEILAPVSNPEKIVCIGLNYLGHCLEQNKEAPKEPMFFSKFASTLTGPTGDVILHKITTVSRHDILLISGFIMYNSYVCFYF